MKVKNGLAAAIVILAACISLIIPFGVLFMGDGVYAWQITQPESKRMLLEIVLAAVLLLTFFLRAKSGKTAFLASAFICLLFTWLHVAFLPMLLSGLYVGYLILAGKLVRGKLLKVFPLHPVFADLLLGAGLVITQFCLLSLLGTGGIPTLRIVCAVQAVLLYAWEYQNVRKNGGLIKRLQSIFEGTEDFLEGKKGIKRLTAALLFMLLLLSVLIQIGKMNVALDFDTLWYGVRSEYILDFGSGIYENPGLVGMAYVYSKGLEVLLLPLSGLASYGYLLFFNIWMAIMGLLAVYKIAGFYMGSGSALFAAALAGAIPGIMNMSISAKTDIVTWLLQLIMVLYLLCYLDGTVQKKEKKNFVLYLILAAGAYLLSLTMKPTSIVFSTAIFGMSGLYLIFSGRVSFKAPLRHWLLLLPAGTALIGIWSRTMLITGMPVMSVFTSIFKALGFSVKYPFATGSLPQNWQEESNLHVLLRRLYQMLLAPEGKDMSHVVIAWGTSILCFLLICLFVFWTAGMHRKRIVTPLTVFTHVVLWPFLAVNLISLVLLYQVDGNYFLLLYTAVILGACASFDRVKNEAFKRLTRLLLIPLFGFNMLLSAESNWAWTVGFSQISLVNSGRVNHKALRYEEMVRKGNGQIWAILEKSSATRVIAFGDHPSCLTFPCNVQSYKDITAPWGNVELVNSPEAFEEYMDYAKTDYVYVEAGFVGEDSWSWSYGLLQQMIERGSLTELFFENGNVLAVVNRDNAGQVSPEAAGNESKDNLRRFMELYRPAQ